MPKHKDQQSSKPAGWRECGYTRQLKLTRQQERHSRRAAGAARSVRNSAVAAGRMCANYGLKKRLDDGREVNYTALDMAREFNAIKKETDPYLKKLGKFVVQGAFLDYEQSVRKWYAAIAETRKLGHCSVHGRKGRKNGQPCSILCGRPRFHSRKRTGVGGFLAASGVASVKHDGHRRITLPVIGNVKFFGKLPGDFIPVAARISFQNGRWFISLNGYGPPLPQTARDTQDAAGVDVGINPLAVTMDSNDVVIREENPKAFYESQGRLAKWQKRQARRKVGSRGWRIAQRHIDKEQRRIVGVRSNRQHHISKRISVSYMAIGIEDLNVKGMDQLSWQAKAIRDAAIGTLLRRIRYKAIWRGVTVVVADRWHPSSKTCYRCGYVNKNLGRAPAWTCPGCGHTHERNVNAAGELRNIALGAVSCRSDAGRGLSSGRGGIPGETDADSDNCRRDPGTEPFIPAYTQLRLAL